MSSDGSAVDDKVEERLGSRRLHERYIGLIAGLLIVYLLTMKIGNSQDVDNYISFAATISSLILALLAIFLSITGNGELSKFVNSAVTINADVRESARELAENTKASNQNAETIAKEITALSDLVSQLRQNVQSGFDDLKSQQQAPPAIMSVPGQQSYAGGVATLSFLEIYFLATVSTSGLVLLLYAAILSKTKSSFDRNALAGALSGATSDYINGFLVACNACHVVDMQTSEAVHTIYKVAFMAEVLRAEIDTRMQSAIAAKNAGLAELIRSNVDAISHFMQPAENASSIDPGSN